jgi:hypothetical protein
VRAAKADGWLAVARFASVADKTYDAEFAPRSMAG